MYQAVQGTAIAAAVSTMAATRRVMCMLMEILHADSAGQGDSPIVFHGSNRILVIVILLLILLILHHPSPHA